MSYTETPIHLVVGMVLDGVADADERQRVGEYIKQLEGERDELRYKRRNAKLLARTKDMHDERWELVSQQVEQLRKLEGRASVLDIRATLGAAANTVELLKDMVDHEHKRTEEAEAKVADLTIRCECAEHAAAFVDTYARYYHEHQLARMAGRESEHPYTFDVWYILSSDIDRRARALMREGELVVSDSEGGFGPDEISIGGDNMSELIAKWMGLQLNGRGSLCPIKEGRSELGLVRLIMERL